MATSRTGTALWKRTRTQAIRQAKRDGLTHCPLCHIVLDYHQGKRRNSIEVDHVIPHAQGGTDHISNVRVICRRCNQSLGGKQEAKAKAKEKQTVNKAQSTAPTTGRNW